MVYLKKSLLVSTAVIFVSLMTAPESRAQKSGPGLGVMLGDPTGVSVKVWTKGPTAFAGGAAWSFRDGGSFHAHLDYLIHKDISSDVRENVRQVEVGGTPMLYFGVGGRLRDEPVDDRLSVRFPLGFTYLFRDSPFDFFVEGVPLLDLAPETEFDVNAALGFRFYL